MNRKGFGNLVLLTGGFFSLVIVLIVSAFLAGKCSSPKSNNFEIDRQNIINEQTKVANEKSLVLQSALNAYKKKKASSSKEKLENLQKALKTP